MCTYIDLLDIASFTIGRDCFYGRLWQEYDRKTWQVSSEIDCPLHSKCSLDVWNIPPRDENSNYWPRACMAENYYDCCLVSEVFRKHCIIAKKSACNSCVIPYKENTWTASVNRMIELCQIFNSYLMWELKNSLASDSYECIQCNDING